MNIDAEACVALETEKFYGKNYYYDAALLRRKFGLNGSANEITIAEPVSMFASQTGLQLEEKCQNVIRMAQHVNEHLSLIDAQALVLTNWSSFVQVSNAQSQICFRIFWDQNFKLINFTHVPGLCPKPLSTIFENSPKKGDI